MTTLNDDERKSVEQMDQKERDKKNHSVFVFKRKKYRCFFFFLKK